MISVLIATRNGARTLPVALERFRALRPAPVPHRVVIVDNGSTDATPAILRAELARAGPGRLPLALLHEPVPGKNRALNRALDDDALRATAGDLVAFTDDDTLPEPDWLRRLWAAAEAHPDYAMFGGTIRPRWMAPPPRWLFEWNAPLGILYAATAEPEGPTAAGNVWGGNMAIRGAVLRQGHRFDTALGTADGPMCSETDLTCRLERAGHRAWFVAGAVVEHMVRPEQTTEAWVLERAFRHGGGFYRHNPAPPPGRFGRLPLRMARDLLAYGAAARLARPLPPSPRRFWWMWKAAWLRGAAASLRDPAGPRTEAGPWGPERGAATAEFGIPLRH